MQRIDRADPDGWTWEWANPEHDFPQLIRYERAGEQLRASIAGPDGQGGTATLEWAFVRAAPCERPRE